eukprot:3935819-Rhodomonas_salina.2
MMVDGAVPVVCASCSVLPCGQESRLLRGGRAYMLHRGGACSRRHSEARVKRERTLGTCAQRDIHRHCANATSLATVAYAVSSHYTT